MKHKKQLLYIILLVACMVLLYSMPVFASELTEADVEQAVADQGKEAVTGNVFIWFLCAIAFLKVSQKIDSFMAKVLVNDPNDSASKNYINREFDMMSEVHTTSNAYWIFDKK